MHDRRNCIHDEDINLCLQCMREARAMADDIFVSWKVDMSEDGTEMKVTLVKKGFWTRLQAINALENLSRQMYSEGV